MGKNDSTSAPKSQPDAPSTPEPAAKSGPTKQEQRDGEVIAKRRSDALANIPKGDKKLPVSELAQMAFPGATKGNHVNGVRAPHVARWMHAAAAAMHCWPQHAHHEAKEMELTPEDYGKAIEAACKLDSKGRTQPHKPALYAVKTPKA